MGQLLWLMTRDLLSLTGRGKFLFLGLFTTQEALLRYRASNANAVFMCLWVSLLTFFFFSFLIFYGFFMLLWMWVSLVRIFSEVLRLEFLIFFFFCGCCWESGIADVARPDTEGQRWRLGCYTDLCVLEWAWAVSWKGECKAYPLLLLLIVLDVWLLIKDRKMNKIEDWIFLLFEAEGAKTSSELSPTLLIFFSSDFSVTKRSAPFSLTRKNLIGFPFFLIILFQYYFEGRYDLVRFIKVVQAAGLYVHLRIGPYICAEWNFG